MKFTEHTVGKKLLMACTGTAMTLFLAIHLIGNSTLYFGPGGINAYAYHLHSLPPLVWAFRLVMLALFAVHVFFGIKLTLENTASRPQPYAVKKSLKATFASKNMIWTGAAIAVFLIYHLLHFTVQITNPGISAVMNTDAVGRPDVFRMVVLSFRTLFIAVIYIAAMIALWLHLSHGIQSVFQTLGMNCDRSLPLVIRAGTAAAILFLAGYVSFPLSVFIGIVKL